MGAEQVLVEEINEHSFDNISQEEKDSLVSDLKLFDSDVLSGLKNNNSVINRVFFSSQKDIFQHWSESLEKLHFLGELQKEIPEVHDISTYMRKQLGRCTFTDDVIDDVVKHDKLYDSMKHSIHPRFKDPFYKRNVEGENPPENTSELKLTPDHTFLLEGLKMFKHYHKRFADLAEDFIKKLEDPEVYKDFEKVTEWSEIAQFSHYLNELASEHGLLDQIEDEQNIKESATLLQKAMFKILYADGGYRQMAAKFGVSPRQNQRIRNRLEDWPEKTAKIVIMKIQGSYLCPCGCGYNIVTQKKMHDITDDRVFPKFRWSEKKFKMPDSLKNKRTNPIDNARLIWGKKVKLTNEKFEEKKLKKEVILLKNSK